MTQAAILVIDDDPDLCELINDTLNETFAIHVCHQADDQAIATAAELRPNVVILDINLPNGNGLDLCQKLHESCVPAPLVLLISGDNSLDLRLEAYSRGGADFLAKPFRVQELRAKVESLASLYKKQQELSLSKDSATRTALNAMMEAAQYGELLRFYNSLYRVDKVETIAEAFFELMANFGLQSSIQIRTAETRTFDYLKDLCSPIELQIYDNLADSDRLIAFSNRLMVNGAYASFIVKNMPTDDTATCGRLRDILATLIEGLDGKLLELQRLQLLRQTAGELAASTQRLTQVMKDHEGFITGAMNHVISEINASFNTLELTEAQEVFFTQLTEKVIHSMEDSFVNVGNETDVLDCLRLSLSAVLGERPR